MLSPTATDDFHRHQNCRRHPRKLFKILLRRKKRQAACTLVKDPILQCNSLLLNFKQRIRFGTERLPSRWTGENPIIHIFLYASLNPVSREESEALIWILNGLEMTDISSLHIYIHKKHLSQDKTVIMIMYLSQRLEITHTRTHGHTQYR